MQTDLHKALDYFFQNDEEYFDGFIKDKGNQNGFIRVQENWTNMLVYCINQIEIIREIKLNDIDIIIRDYCETIVYGGKQGEHKIEGFLDRAKEHISDEELSLFLTNKIFYTLQDKKHYNSYPNCDRIFQRSIFPVLENIICLLCDELFKYEIQYNFSITINVYGILDEITKDKPQLKPRFLSKFNERIESLKYFEIGIDQKGNDKGFESWVGESDEIKEVKEEIKARALDNEPVLIVGESGTGKEKVAEAIHKIGIRKNKNIVAVNCATLLKERAHSDLFGHAKGSFSGAITDRPGYFMEANKGILFLDEFHHLDLNIQSMLLRVIEENKVYKLGKDTSDPIDVKIIFATTIPEEEIFNPSDPDRPHFLSDLINRLNPYEMIYLPPIRDRGNDIFFLVDHFLQEECVIPEMDEYALALMKSYEYKDGNIRMLGNMIRKLSKIIKRESEPVMKITSDHIKKYIGQFHCRIPDIHDIELAKLYLKSDLHKINRYGDVIKKKVIIDTSLLVYEEEGKRNDSATSRKLKELDMTYFSSKTFFVSETYVTRVVHQFAQNNPNNPQAKILYKEIKSRTRKKTK